MIRKAVLLILFCFSVSLTHGSDRTIAPGAHAVDFSLPDSTGRTVSLSRFAGRSVMLVFWGTKNSYMTTHSRKVLSFIQEKSRQDPKWPVVVTILESAPDASVVREYTTGLPVLFDTDQKVYAAYGVILLPTVILLTPEHTVKAVVCYSSEFRDRLEHVVHNSSGRVSQPKARVPGSRHGASEKYVQMAGNFLRQQSYDLALSYVNKALKQDAKDARARTLKAYIILKQGAPTDAENLLRAVLADKAFRSARILLGRSLILQKKFAEAETVLNAIQGQDMLKSLALAECAEIYDKQGDPERAGRMRTAALKILREHDENILFP